MEDVMIPVAQPRTRRAQAKAERRQALIDATITSIERYGLSGTTIARVTEIAGTSIGLANFHFEHKELLLEGVLEHLAGIEQSLWQHIVTDTTQSPAELLLALLDARFDALICNPKTLAVWFAFWGDAGARSIYRRVVEDTDDARLTVTVALIERMGQGAGTSDLDAVQTALGLEAFYDGLWLNNLLYPDEFERSACRQRAVEHLIALFPAHFSGPHGAALRANARLPMERK